MFWAIVLYAMAAIMLVTVPFTLAKAIHGPMPVRVSHGVTNMLVIMITAGAVLALLIESTYSGALTVAILLWAILVVDIIDGIRVMINGSVQPSVARSIWSTFYALSLIVGTSLLVFAG